MAATLRRSAYSTNIKTRADFSCAFFDARHARRSRRRSRSRATSARSCASCPPRSATTAPTESGPGDGILVNHPYLGGGHLNDVTLIAPFFHDGEILGYVACLAHHVDVGGGAPASVGSFREVFQEGIIIPPVKLVAGGEIVTDIYRLVLEQIRSKRETAGDLRAQIACNNTGVRRLTTLVDQLGREPFMAFLDELLAYTARRTEAALKALPRGVFEADGLIDTDGYTDEPGQAARQGRHRRRRRPVRPQRLGQAAARAGQLDLRPDLLELRLRPADADRPRHPRQRRLLRPRPGRGAGGHDPPRDPPAPGRRRLGDLDPDGRDAVRRARAGLPGARARRARRG